MRLAIARIVAAAALADLADLAAAVMVTSDSPCDQQCGNVLDATTTADIECEQNDYGSSAGVVFKNCLDCEMASNAYQTNPNQSDQQWMLYNSRFALSQCLFGYPGNISVDSTPCITSRACGPLQNAFQYGNLSTDLSIGAYDYCVDWQDATFYEACVDCLLDFPGQEFLANMVVLLQVGCDQKPALGSTVSVEGSIFSTTIMNETDPTPTSSWTSFVDSGPISLAGKVGIAIGGVCLLLAVAGFCIVCNGRRRRRAFLRKLEMRQKDADWPHPLAGGPVHRGADMNDTPLSQKPLRGWDDSPQSAVSSEPGSYARYFSPYASQQTSPVSGAAGHNMMANQWPQQFHDEPTYGGYPSSAQEKTMQDHSFPSSSQEKAMQSQHEAATAPGTATPPMHIGLALGGDEPSLHSKPSAGSALSKELHDEAYELHEVSSSAGGSSAGGTNRNVLGSSQSFRNRMAANSAPVLQHPGYGRYSPDRVLPPPPPPTHTISGGLVDDGDNRL